VSEHADDPTLAALRAQIEAADREILAAFLRRLDVARQVRHHKDEHGYAFVDAGREQELLKRWLAAADGALPEQTLEELFAVVLALSKREASRPD
jgi:chorismate mutase